MNKRKKGWGIAKEEWHNEDEVDIDYIIDDSYENYEYLCCSIQKRELGVRVKALDVHKTQNMALNENITDLFVDYLNPTKNELTMFKLQYGFSIEEGLKLLKEVIGE